jgi:hypothetical protein
VKGVQITTDGHKAYLEAVENAFGHLACFNVGAMVDELLAVLFSEWRDRNRAPGWRK